MLKEKRKRIKEIPKWKCLSSVGIFKNCRANCSSPRMSDLCFCLINDFAWQKITFASLSVWIAVWERERGREGLRKCLSTKFNIESVSAFCILTSSDSNVSWVKWRGEDLEFAIIIQVAGQRMIFDSFEFHILRDLQGGEEKERGEGNIFYVVCVLQVFLWVLCLVNFGHQRGKH